MLERPISIERAINAVGRRWKMRRKRMMTTDLARLKRLNFGCGYDYREGYLNIDMDPESKADFLIDGGDLSALPKGHYEEILAYDVLEHIPRHFATSALLDWAALLKMGGSLTVQTSSVLGVAELMGKNDNFEFQYNWSACMFGNQAHPGDYHHNGFTEKTLRVLLDSAGFQGAEFELRDGWLLWTTVRKTSDWTALLRAAHLQNDNAGFIREAFQTFLMRDATDTDVQNFASMPSRYELLKKIAGSPERLYKIAVQLGL